MNLTLLARRPISLVCLMCVSCVSSQTIRPDTLARTPLDAEDGRLELKTRAGEAYAVNAPFKASASLGVLHVEPPHAPHRDFTLHDVRELELVTPSAGRTFGLVLGATTAGLAIGLAVAMLVNGFNHFNQSWQNFSFHD